MVIPYQLHALHGTDGRLTAGRGRDPERRNAPASRRRAAAVLRPVDGPRADRRLGFGAGRCAYPRSIPRPARPACRGCSRSATSRRYPGKLKLILQGFSEAAMAAHAIFPLVRPNEALHFEYSTTKGVPVARSQAGVPDLDAKLLAWGRAAAVRDAGAFHRSGCSPTTRGCPTRFRPCRACRAGWPASCSGMTGSRTVPRWGAMSRASAARAGWSWSSRGMFGSPPRLHAGVHLRGGRWPGLSRVKGFVTSSAHGCRGSAPGVQGWRQSRVPVAGLRHGEPSRRGIARTGPLVPPRAQADRSRSALWAVSMAGSVRALPRGRLPRRRRDRRPRVTASVAGSAGVSG